ncbi:MAG TPA: pilus assembly protein TadG-related protein [Pirellulales bacterium]|jgi:Flp pilus assembly protein TadG|nr:pilus assembly protein TadG-related protein [Pirellulales bacterium]
MTPCHKNKNHREGTIAILACFLMIGMLGMVAFAVDLGYLANSQTELQRTADATALAACEQLRYSVSGTPGTAVSLTNNVTAASTAASQYAAANKVCAQAPGLAASDVVIGYMANPANKTSTIQATGSVNNYNAVQVTVRRSASENGLVPSFFGKIFGQNGEAARASATAAFLGNVSGFGIPSAGTGPGGGTGNLMIMPFALDLQTWNALLAGTGADVWKWDATKQQVIAGSDGILECNLFPQGTGSPGNRGTVSIGCSNGTSNLVRQILNGLSASDLAPYGGTLQLDSTGNLYLPANPGISAGDKSALASIIGQTRIIPIFSSVSGNGANAMYDIVQFVGIRVLDVNLTGSMSSKHLTVQPAWVYARGAVAASSANGSQPSQSSYGVFSPVWLVR